MVGPVRTPRRDGFDDGEEVLVLGTDPLDPLDPTPVPLPEPAAHLVVLAGGALLGLLQRDEPRDEDARVP